MGAVPTLVSMAMAVAVVAFVLALESASALVVTGLWFPWSFVAKEDVEVKVSFWALSGGVTGRREPKEGALVVVVMEEHKMASLLVLRMFLLVIADVVLVVLVTEL